MTSAQRRMIFKLSGERGLDDELLHAFIFNLTGKKSTKELTITEAVKVIDGLSENSGCNITFRQIKYIYALAVELGWVDEHGNANKAAINRFISKQTRVATVQWLTQQQASSIIEQMKNIKLKDNEKRRAMVQ